MISKRGTLQCIKNIMTNKHKDIILSKYTDYDEDTRLVKDRAHHIEYLTTMRYIQQFLKPKAKILEIGAGTGRYAITLAKMGYEVVAVDLVPKHVETMKRKSRRLKNFQCMVADALDLSLFKDNSFDMVLNLGPLYHLFHQKDKNKAVKETLRVAKKDGICMFAYLSGGAIMISYGLRKNKVIRTLSCMDKTGRVKDIPEEVFAAFYIEDFKKLFAGTKTKYITNVATDGIAPAMSEYLEQLSRKGYQAFLNWHFMTCERPDQQGLSSHLLYICRKK